MKIELQIIEKLKQFESLTISQIAEHLNKDLTSISKVVSKLEKKKLVKKLTYPIPGTRARANMVILEKDNLSKWESDNLSKNKRVKKNKLSKKQDPENDNLSKNSNQQIDNLSISDSLVDVSTEVTEILSQDEEEIDQEFDNLSKNEGQKIDNLSIPHEGLRSLYQLYFGHLPGKVKKMKKPDLQELVKTSLNNPKGFAQFLKRVTQYLEMM